MLLSLYMSQNYFSWLCSVSVGDDMETLGAYRYGHADATSEATAIVGAHNNLPLIDIEQTVNQNRGESHPFCHGTSQKSSPIHSVTGASQQYSESYLSGDHGIIRVGRSEVRHLTTAQAANHARLLSYSASATSGITHSPDRPSLYPPPDTQLPPTHGAKRIGAGEQEAALRVQRPRVRELQGHAEGCGVLGAGEVVILAHGTGQAGGYIACHTVGVADA